MKLPLATLFLLAFITTIHALALPDAFGSIADSTGVLFRRKGGGGGGGKGGSSSSGSSGGSSSSGSKGGSSGSSSSSGSSKGSTGITSTSSNAGGRTKSGSGIAPSYGSSGYYAGGASVPYKSGSTSPSGLSSRYLPVALLAFYPGVWAYGAYVYDGGRYPYHNDTSNQNQTLPVDCLCAQYQECGCDNNTDTSWLDAVANNSTISRVADVNGTETLVVNGTLANGTTASGGTSSAASSFIHSVLETDGWLILAAGVACIVWAL